MYMKHMAQILRQVHTLPADFRKAIDANPAVRAMWENITPFARRDWILWITSAKLSETRARRIDKTCAMLTAGKRRVCCFGGINWLIKMNEAKRAIK